MARDSYDRVRAALLLRRTAGAGAPPAAPLSADEAAALARGLRELSALRRASAPRRSAAHPPTLLVLRISLRKQRLGNVARRVTYIRTVLQPDGKVIDEEASLHVFVGRGASPGGVTVYAFSGAGSETSALLPGEVRVSIADKPCAGFKRLPPHHHHPSPAVAQPHSAARLPSHHLLRVQQLPPSSLAVFAEDVPALDGRRILLAAGSALCASLSPIGGFFDFVYPGEGLPDPTDPWGKPCGDLIVRFTFPPPPACRPRRLVLWWALPSRAISPSPIASPHLPFPPPPPPSFPLLLIGCSSDALPAAAAGGVLAASLRHEAACADLRQRPPMPPCVCLVLCSGHRDAAASPSPAAAAFCDASARCGAGDVAWRVVRAVLCSQPSMTRFDVACGRDGDVFSQLRLFDDEAAAIHAAPALLLDWPRADAEDCTLDPISLSFLDAEEAAIRSAACYCASSPLGALLASFVAPRFLVGALRLCAIGRAASLLGAFPPCELCAAHPILLPHHPLIPWVVRVGGGAGGWRALHRSLSTWPAPDAAGVGLPLGAVLQVSAAIAAGGGDEDDEGECELIVSPSAAALSERAAGAAAHGGPHRSEKGVAWPRGTVGWPERTTAALCRDG